MFGTDDIIGAVAGIGGKLIDRLWPDPQQANEAKLKLFEMTQNGELAKMANDTKLAEMAASIVEAEAKSESWLTRSWRPITMLTFVGLIVARMFGYTAPNVSEMEYIRLWDLMNFGLGGYVVGRSALQVTQAIAPAVTAALKK